MNFGTSPANESAKENIAVSTFSFLAVDTEGVVLVLFDTLLKVLLDGLTLLVTLEVRVIGGRLGALFCN